MVQTRSAPRLEPLIDRIRCDGYGICAELLPEMLELDDWGYPIMASAGVPADLVDYARRAVAGCPVLALRLRAQPAGQVQASLVPARPWRDRVRSAAGG